MWAWSVDGIIAGWEGERTPDVNRGKGTGAGTGQAAAETPSSGSVCSGGGQALRVGDRLASAPSPSVHVGGCVETESGAQGRCEPTLDAPNSPNKWPRGGSGSTGEGSQGCLGPDPQPRSWRRWKATGGISVRQEAEDTMVDTRGWGDRGQETFLEGAVRVSRQKGRGGGWSRMPVF